MAAINNDTPARISGDVILIAEMCSSAPTQSQSSLYADRFKIILAPISINLSVKTTYFQTSSDVSVHCPGYVTTNNTLIKSGVNPGHGASYIVITDPSINVWIS